MEVREQIQREIINGVQWLRLGVETIGALIVALGVLIALTLLVRALLSGQISTFNAIRLILARYLALALEFQLGADILSTAVDPSPKQIGQLGAIAVIRTALNFFLSREMREEQKEAGNEENVQQRALQPRTHTEGPTTEITRPHVPPTNSTFQGDDAH